MLREHRRERSEEPEPESISEGISPLSSIGVPPTVPTRPTELTDEPQHDDISPSAEAIGDEDHELHHEHEHSEPALTYVPVLAPARTPVHHPAGHSPLH